MHERLSLAAALAALTLGGCGSAPVEKNPPVYSPTRPVQAQLAQGGYGGNDSPPAYAVRHGQVRSIERVNARETTSGGGAIAGALLGAVIGRQMGGTPAARDAATAVGLVGGAVAGNEAEKHRRGATDVWRVTVDLEGGSAVRIDVTDAAGLRPGERVRVEGNRIHRL